MVEIHDILCDKSKKYNESVYYHAPTFSETSTSYKAQMSKMGYELLERGRGTQLFEGDQSLHRVETVLRRGDEAWPKMILEHAVHLLSNKATCAEYCKHWPLARHDMRFTIFMKPDYIRSYQMMPKIAEKFHSKKLKELCDDRFNKVREGYRESPINKWRRFTQREVAILSFRAIIMVRLGKLDEEKIQELMIDGIEDMYTSCNVSAELMLPLRWLKDNDNEYI